MYHRTVKRFNAFVATLLAVFLFAAGPLARFAFAQANRTEKLPQLIQEELSRQKDRLDALLQKPIEEKRMMREKALIAGGSYVYQPPARNSSASVQKGSGRTITVANTEDDGPGSLRHALFEAADGDTINIAARGTITLTSGELVVDKSLTIRGPGTTRLSLNGNAAGRVFHITPNTTVTIAGLKITNGSVTGAFPASAGGGILNDHAVLTINNCIISGNSARLGGAIFSNSMDGGSASLTVNDSALNNNSGGFAGGGIFSGGGFLNTGPSGDATVMISHSMVIGNAARFGGGIFNDGFSGSARATINNSTITNNTGYFGIYNNGDSGVAIATLNDSAVDSNYLGGFFNDGSSSISQGNASMTAQRCGFSNNAGGGIVNSGVSSGFSGSATLTLNDSAITGNTGAFFGGGINNQGGRTDYGELGSATATLTNTLVSENHDGRIGGGVNNSGTALMTLDRSTVSGNSVNQWGGGINADNGAMTVLNNSIVSGNSASDPFAATLGGGIFNQNSELKLTNSTIDGNSTSSGGFAAGGGIANETSGAPATVTILNSTISGNSTTASYDAVGGGIYNLGSKAPATVLVTDSTISGNLNPSSSETAGGIYNTGIAILRLNNSTLSGNQGVGITNFVFQGNSPTLVIANTIFMADASGQNIYNDSGTVTSHGYNLSSDAAGGFLTGSGDQINTDPLLGPLQDNGGPTMTHALLLHSPAIDAGDPNFDPNAFIPPLLNDQRNGPGFLRVVNGRIDIGAFESRHP